MAESEGICFPSRHYGWIIGIDFDFLSDLFVFTSAAFVFWHWNLYHLSFCSCGWSNSIGSDFLSDLFVFTSVAFVFWHRNLYHFFFRRCGRQIAISPDHCLVLLPLCCFCRSRESWASAVSAAESCTVSGCLSRLNLAVAEGRIFCGSAVAASKSLNSLIL